MLKPLIEVIIQFYSLYGCPWV